MLLGDLSFRVFRAKEHVRRWSCVALLCAVVGCPAISWAGPTVWYPPVPAALGGAVASRDAAVPAPPAELATYATEIFYAPLSAQLASGRKPSEALRARLESYHATRTALQAELAAKIYLLRDSEAASRLATLEEFSREQTPRVIALEAAAESLRRDLIAEGAEDRPLPGDEATALRAAAFFQEGWSPDQRRLLLEMAAENEGATLGGSDGGWFFFSPAGARIRPLVNESAPCTARVRRYEEEKTALKQEVRTVSAKSSSAAARAELAMRQAPRFAELEVNAEEIRRSLAVRNDPTRRPELPPMPPELDARIVAYRREKLDLQKALLARVEEVTKKLPSHGSAPQQQEKIRDAIAAYTKENATRYAALDKNRDLLRRELARLSPGAPAGATSADALLKKFSEAMQQLEFWRNYRDYQFAVLQPGLSPEQRRLLFSAALETLALAKADAPPSP
jgi:hypothetical protein